jgi:hypothetical protein
VGGACLIGCVLAWSCICVYLGVVRGASKWVQCVVGVAGTKNCINSPVFLFFAAEPTHTDTKEKLSTKIASILPFYGFYKQCLKV